MNARFSLSPLFRQSVGFDRYNDLFENAFMQNQTGATAYPPYNIEKTDDNNYIVTMAVAGFNEQDLDITISGNTLLIKGQRDNGSEKERQYLYRGIATRPFEKAFSVADHVKVLSAQLNAGMLTISLVRETPEASKPKKIVVNAQTTTTGQAA
jgi:molecular chaperone IbpA